MCFTGCVDVHLHLEHYILFSLQNLLAQMLMKRNCWCCFLRILQCCALVLAVAVHCSGMHLLC